MDQIEVQRGSYTADLGDRTYGVFNVVPRNGFERNREAELHITGGNFYTGETALSAGNHSQKAAWYASVAATRSNYGLETPTAGVFHDATNSQSGFGSLLVNPNATNQLRFNGQLRQDFFQVPYDSNLNSWLNQLSVSYTHLFTGNCTSRGTIARSSFDGQGSCSTGRKDVYKRQSL